MARGSRPRSSASQSTTPGSRAPQRVPMQRPSSTLKPMVVATLRPACRAHRLAPLPRCIATVRPRAAAGSSAGSAEATYS